MSPPRCLEPDDKLPNDSVGAALQANEKRKRANAVGESGGKKTSHTKGGKARPLAPETATLRIQENGAQQGHQTATKEPVMVLLHSGVKKEGAVPFDREMVALPLPQIHGDTALMSQGLLHPQYTFGEQGMKDIREPCRGDGKEIITDPIHTARATALGAGKQAAESDKVAHVVDIPLPAWPGRQRRLGVSVGKSLDRAYLGCLNASEMEEDDTRNLVGISGENAVLPGTAG